MEQMSSAFPLPRGKGILMGLAAAMGAAILLIFFFSALLAAGVPDGWTSLFAVLTTLFAGVSGGLVAGLKEKSNGLLYGLLTGAALFLLHFLSTVIFGQISLSCLSFLAAEVLGGILGGIFGVNLRR